MVCEQELVIQKVCQLYDEISGLETLKPCQNVDTLFTQLVLTCIPPTPIDVTKLTPTVQEIRSKLIKLCGVAEGFLESHFSTLLANSYDNPLQHLDIFPYYSNYLKLSHLEFNILTQHINIKITKMAFVGSGPLPLTSIVLATHHLPDTTFHNYDIDGSANCKAMRLVSSDPDLSKRMVFYTSDVLDVSSNSLKEYEVVYLAALVGMDSEEKNRIIDHLANNMAPGALLMLRSAHGARAFLYPIVDPSELRPGFEVLTVFHPTDDVINSVVVARKYPIPINNPDHDHHHDHEPHHQALGVGSNIILPLPNKCRSRTDHDIHQFQVYNNHHGNNNIIDQELVIEEKI